jgi:hypothetical protein
MGRHGRPASRRPLPWDLVGWCAFAGVVAAVALVLMGEPWTTALLVLATGLVAVLIVLGLALLAPRSGESAGRRRDHL